MEPIHPGMTIRSRARGTFRVLDVVDKQVYTKPWPERVGESAGIVPLRDAEAFLAAGAWTVVGRGVWSYEEQMRIRRFLSSKYPEYRQKKDQLRP